MLRQIAPTKPNCYRLSFRRIIWYLSFMVVRSTNLNFQLWMGRRHIESCILHNHFLSILQRRKPMTPDVSAALLGVDPAAITRALLALWAGKIAIAASRTFGHGGSNFPGKLARRIDPTLTGKLAGRNQQGVLVVTGTNGKTTTARMLSSVLSYAGFKVTHNRSGANLAGGIASALVEAAPWFPRKSIANGVGILEVDEAALVRVAKDLKPRVVVVTNFFRDQLDRYGELIHMVNLVQQGIEEAAASKVVLNADDPAAAKLGEECGDKALFYGIADDSLGGTESFRAADLRHCVHCGFPYEYSVIFYSHLGHYRCPRCGNQRPSPSIALEKAALTPNGYQLKITTPSGPVEAEVPVVGVYNLYNAIASTAAACAIGTPLETIAQGLERYTASFGRMESLHVQNRELRVALVKNPVGFDQVITVLLASPTTTPRHLLLAINDLVADGTDISWLWDVDFERLGPASGTFGDIVCSGIRAEDIALRLQYAGFPPDKICIENDLATALKRAIASTPVEERLWICPTYTALLQLRHLLHRHGEAKGFWEV